MSNLLLNVYLIFIGAQAILFSDSCMWCYLRAAVLLWLDRTQMNDETKTVTTDKYDACYSHNMLPLSVWSTSSGLF